MKTFTKIAAIGLVAFLAFHFRNLLLAPLAVALAIGLVVALLLGITAITVLGLGAGLAFTLLGAAVAAIVGLAPIWIPVLAVVGFLSLLRRHRAKNAAATTVA